MADNYSKKLFDDLKEQLIDEENLTKDILNKAMQNAINKHR